MKRFLLLLLVLLVLPLGQALANNPTDAFAADLLGTWYQVGEQGNPWQIKFRENGTGTMSSAHQNVEYKWNFNMLDPDCLMFLGIYVHDSDGTMAYFDDFLYDHGMLIANNGRIYDRGEPDPVFFQPYEAAQMAPLSAFDGVWQLTGGLITVQKPPMTIEIGDADFAEWELKPPIYIGIFDGMVATSNQGQPLSKDPSFYDPRLQSYYAGNALYVGVQSLGVTAVLYYVSPAVHHLKHPAGVEPEFGIDTVFTLYMTDLDSVPPSDSEDPDISFTLMPPPPKP